jgi:transposase
MILPKQTIQTPPHPPQVLVVGVDPHRATHMVCVMDRDGREVCQRFRISNNRVGVQQLAHRLNDVAQSGRFDHIQLATEATNWYWLGMFCTLRQASPLPVELHAINPRLSANFKKALMTDDHTDASDAFVIAERLRMGRDLPPPFDPEAVYLPLRLLTRQRFRLVKQLVNEKAYAANLIYLKASDYTLPDKQPFADVFGVTSRAVLTQFDSLEQILAMSLDELSEWIDQHGKRRFADPAANARKLQAVARESFVLPKDFQRPIQIALELSLQHITTVEQQLKRLDIAITEQLAALNIPNPLTTIPGIGPVLAAGLIAEIGDVRRFNNDDDKVAKMAGFKWRQHQSAGFVADDTPITLHCNRYLRYYFCEAAQLVRIHEPEYAAFYQKKYDEATKHHHKRALVLTARKLVRLVVHLLATRQTYQPRSVRVRSHKPTKPTKPTKPASQSNP